MPDATEEAASHSCGGGCAPATSIEFLNRSCYCLSLDEVALRDAFAADPGLHGLSDIAVTHPHLFASVPAITSPWAWGDPGHTRVISLESLTFLNQDEYARQVEVMTEYRHVYPGDLRPIMAEVKGDTFAFVLQAHN